MADDESAAPSGEGGAEEIAVELACGAPSEPTAEYDFSVDPAIGSLTDQDLRYLSANLRELIAHRIEGINYAEGRRSQFLTIGGAIAAAGVALLPFASQVDWVPLRAVYIELSLSSVALGGAIWIVYAWQTNYNYPFKDQLANWKWFYHQALPDKRAFGPGLVRNRGRKRRQSEYDQVAEQWPKFAQQAIGLATPRVDATQDLKQLYQLHVNELYKNLFLTQLRTLLMRGLGVVCVGAILTFVIALFAYTPGDAVAQSEWHGGRTETSAAWKATGEVRTDGVSSLDVQFRLQAAVTNRSAHKVTWTELVMLDKDHDPIPAEFLLTPNTPTVVAPGETVDISGYFWVAGSDREKMQTLMPK